MALDPRIPLSGGTVPDLLSAVSGGLQLGSRIRNQPLQEALMRAQLEQQQNPSSALQRGQGVVTRQGEQAFIQTPVFNPNTGSVDIVSSAIPGQLASRTGETPDQQLSRQIAAARAKADIKVQQEEQLAPVKAEQAAQQERAKLQEQLATQPQITKATTTAKDQAVREGKLIAEGVEAAKGIPTLRRSIGLLDQVDTGGFSAVSLRAKQIFGVEGADEGELSSNLGQAILGDLRQTFGAAFTEKEGERLERIRANFGKSAETNKRLLRQSLQIAERAATRAQERAVANKDFVTAQEIQDLLNFEFNFEPPQAEAPQPQSFEGFEILRIRPE